MLVAPSRTPHQFPELTTALVVCRECLQKHNVESLPHVVTLVDEWLNPFSSRKKVGRACRLGLPRRALEYAAARDPDWANGQYMAAAAVIRGFVHVLQWLNECYPERTSWGDGHEGSSRSAANGHLGTVQWLYANRGERVTANALRSAAKYGHLNVVQWLSEIVRNEPRGDACVQDAARIACQAGHVQVAQHLEQVIKQMWLAAEVQLFYLLDEQPLRRGQ
ncbi:hypothetical protein PHYPSEUDO_010344 [Phytophthora pseudosyringae]|uniref:Ankyrin repeat protein n=1 Tax=Phytophthora pseudosyringae TaxID=221518 RepID=A0A8T1WCT7_9STRA|nr:hypothetical protein PHYPSEUDO_010344 [Phytophthora pseudosyringae]